MYGMVGGSCGVPVGIIGEESALLLLNTRVNYFIAYVYVQHPASV